MPDREDKRRLSTTSYASYGWGHPSWPEQPKIVRRSVVRWICPVSRDPKVGQVRDVSWTESTVAKWAVDWLPRWLWWIGTNKVNEVSYRVRGNDGKEYDIYESELTVIR